MFLCNPLYPPNRCYKSNILVNRTINSYPIFINIFLGFSSFIPKNFTIYNSHLHFQFSQIIWRLPYHVGNLPFSSDKLSFTMLMFYYPISEFHTLSLATPALYFFQIIQCFHFDIWQKHVATGYYY